MTESTKRTENQKYKFQTPNISDTITYNIRGIVDTDFNIEGFYDNTISTILNKLKNLGINTYNFTFEYNTRFNKISNISLDDTNLVYTIYNDINNSTTNGDIVKSTIFLYDQTLNKLLIYSTNYLSAAEITTFDPSATDTNIPSESSKNTQKLLDTITVSVFDLNNNTNLQYLLSIDKDPINKLAPFNDSNIKYPDKINYIPCRIMSYDDPISSADDTKYNIRNALYAFHYAFHMGKTLEKTKSDALFDGLINGKKYYENKNYENKKGNYVYYTYLNKSAGYDKKELPTDNAFVYEISYTGQLCGLYSMYDRDIFEHPDKKDIILDIVYRESSLNIQSLGYFNPINIINLSRNLLQTIFYIPGIIIGVPQKLLTFAIMNVSSWFGGNNTQTQTEQSTSATPATPATPATAPKQ